MSDAGSAQSIVRLPPITWVDTRALRSGFSSSSSQIAHKVTVLGINLFGSKHSGLEKAVIQIEQALKRSSRAGGDQIQNAEQASELRYLLERSRDLLNAESSNSSLPRHYSVSNGTNTDQQQVTASSPHHTTISQETPPSQAGSREGASAQSIEDEHLNLDDAENPLQLLARTSELLSSIEPQQLLATGSSRSSQKPGSGRDNDLQSFFGSFQPRLDIGEDLDPIELGLITLAEAEALFS